MKDITPAIIDNIEDGDLVTVTSNRDGLASVEVTAYAVVQVGGFVSLDIPAGAMDGTRPMDTYLPLRVRGGYPGHWYVTRIQRQETPLPTEPGTVIFVEEIGWRNVGLGSLAMLDKRGMWNLVNPTPAGDYTITRGQISKWRLP